MEDAISQDYEMKVRRIARVGLHCVANIACYRAGWDDEQSPPKLKISDDFWVRANGNFLDAATLNWCILFAEEDKGKHDWKKAFANKDGLSEELYKALKIPEEEFNKELLEIKKYRDKYLAHMDNPSAIFYPKTEFMLTSSLSLLSLLESNVETKSFLTGAYYDPRDHYREKHEEALKIINGCSEFKSESVNKIV